MNASLSVYPSPTCWGTSGSFQFWVIVHKAAVDYFQFGVIVHKAAINICVQVFSGHMFSLHLCKYLGVECLGHMFNFLRNYQFFQSY